MSAPATGRSSRRGPWVVAAIAALVAFVVPMAVVSSVADPEPEIRVLATAGRISSLIVDGDARMLVINSGDREAASAFFGRIARPWESRSVMVVAASDDASAVGLWEALSRLDPATVLVAGIPGADPLWSEIDDECARRQIDLRYVADRAVVAAGRVTVTVFGVPPDAEGGRAVVVHRGDASVIITLDARVPRIDGQALLHNGELDRSVDLLVTSDAPTAAPRQQTIVVDDRDVVRLVIEERRIRVFGGVLRSPVNA